MKTVKRSLFFISTRLGDRNYRKIKRIYPKPHIGMGYYEAFSLIE
ncbi:hypothetical protein [Maribacter sp.]|nr:hypothetical protein [Maribacter sp.]